MSKYRNQFFVLNNYRQGQKIMKRKKVIEEQRREILKGKKERKWAENETFYQFLRRSGTDTSISWFASHVGRAAMLWSVREGSPKRPATSLLTERFC